MRLPVPPAKPTSKATIDMRYLDASSDGNNALYFSFAFTAQQGDNGVYCFHHSTHPNIAYQ